MIVIEDCRGASRGRGRSVVDGWAVIVGDRAGRLQRAKGHSEPECLWEVQRRSDFGKRKALQDTVDHIHPTQAFGEVPAPGGADRGCKGHADLQT